VILLPWLGTAQHDVWSEAAHRQRLWKSAIEIIKRGLSTNQQRIPVSKVVRLAGYDPCRFAKHSTREFGGRLACIDGIDLPLPDHHTSKIGRR